MKYLSLCLAVSLVAGCSSVTRMTDVTNLIDYSDHKSVKVLEVPADLDSPDFDRTYLTDVSDNAAKGIAVTDAVPLVDSSLAAPSLSQTNIIARGGEQALRIDNDKLIWKRTLDAMKSMGITVSKSDESTGLIEGRDRSLVSDPGSPIGAFLNKSLGKLNQGASYKVSVVKDGESAFVTFRDGAGKPLAADQANSVLKRFLKEYTSS